VTDDRQAKSEEDVSKLRAQLQEQVDLFDAAQVRTVAFWVFTMVSMVRPDGLRCT
jgi:hypothetical protein